MVLIHFRKKEIKKKQRNTYVCIWNKCHYRLLLLISNKAETMFLFLFGNWVWDLSWALMLNENNISIIFFDRFVIFRLFFPQKNNTHSYRILHQNTLRMKNCDFLLRKKNHINFQLTSSQNDFVFFKFIINWSMYFNSFLITMITSRCPLL